MRSICNQRPDAQRSFGGHNKTSTHPRPSAQRPFFSAKSGWEIFIDWYLRNLVPWAGSWFISMTSVWAKNYFLRAGYIYVYFFFFVKSPELSGDRITPFFLVKALLRSWNFISKSWFRGILERVIFSTAFFLVCIVLEWNAIFFSLLIRKI